MQINSQQIRSISFLLVSLCLLGADWRQFRGSDGDGVAKPTELPKDWAASEAWKVDLPGKGPSSPIVVGDRVFVTASSGANQERLHVLCFDAGSGKQHWHRQFWATGRTFCHHTSANAAPTPASDGKHVFAFFSSNDLICLDLEGDLRWYRGLARERPRAGNDIGMSSSPLVVDGVVVVQVENQGDPFAMAIDAASGKTAWAVKRRPMAAWSSPILHRDAKGTAAVLLQSPWGITAHDPRSGSELWKYEAECQTIPSAASADGMVYVPSEGITALDARSASADGIKATWTESRLQPSGASPLVYRGQLFAINRAGVLSCVDLKTKEIAWRLRLNGHHYATPVAVGDHLLLVSNKGQLEVVRLGAEGEQAGTFDLGAENQATPAVASGGIFVRSDKSLRKFAAN